MNAPAAIMPIMTTGPSARPHHQPDELLERDRELALFGRAFESAATGTGTGIALSGESGAGKSALVASALRATHGLRVLRGQCEPLRTPRPLGPVRDLGLAGLEELVRSDARLSDIGEHVYATLGAEPTVVVVEDLHWIDEASAEVLRFLARRVESAPLVMVLTYRDDEIGLRHPGRGLLGDVAALDGLTTVQLAPLSVGAVATAVAGTGLDPSRVHALTGGNAFFVSQVAKDPDRPLPPSVRDAVLARVADVDLGDLEVLQLIACAPDRLDDRVLPLVDVDLPTLRRLNETTLLGRDDHGLVFRHELARLAVESTIPPGGASVLHLRLLDALERLELNDPAVLTHHAVAARDSLRATAYAQAAAAEATAAASNAEAAAFLEIALEYLPSTTPPIERARLLLQLSLQQYLTSRISEAIGSARASIPLAEGAGAPALVAEAYSVMAVLEYHSARRRYVDQYAARALEIAEVAGDPATSVRTQANAAFLAMIGGDLDAAVAGAERTVALATEAGMDEYVTAGRMFREMVDSLSGDQDARARVLELGATARDRGWDELASRAFDVTAFADVEQGNLRGLRAVVDAGLAHSAARDLPVARLWLLAARATLHLLHGRWDAAVEDASAVVTGDLLPGCLHPDLVLAAVALRRGETEVVAPHVERMWATAQGLEEPMRLLSAGTLLAEVMWMTGREDSRVVDLSTRFADLGGAPDTRWPAGHLALWLRRLDLPFKIAELGLPEPFASSLEGRHADAAEWWHRAGSSYHEALAWADSNEEEDRSRAVGLLDRLEAVAVADKLRRGMREDGLAQVPQRPQASTRANPFGLTNRQLEVARLVARGGTNGEIAAQLYISLKTTEVHVSAILAKLGVPNRRAVVTQADELGLV
jgi:DNA-binding CsgD family transcriptional regulator